jgi:hypothetical protein
MKRFKVIALISIVLFQVIACNRLGPEELVDAYDNGCIAGIDYALNHPATYDEVTSYVAYCRKIARENVQ